MALYNIAYGTVMTMVEYKSKFELTRATPWVIYGDFRENWPRYNSTALYLYSRNCFYTQSLVVPTVSGI